LKPKQAIPQKVETTEGKLASIYQPANEREMKALAKQHERRKKAIPAPSLKLSEVNGKKRISVDHQNGAAGFTLLMEAMGTTNADFADGLLNQICNVASANYGSREDKANFALSMVTGMEPRDQVEAMLATQMAAIHMAAMSMANRVGTADTLVMLESHEKAMNRLARTFAAQVEALKRYRSKGEQRVYVERVDVREGGQAVVGNVSHGEGV
jgi:hypothetical protein